MKSLILLLALSANTFAGEYNYRCSVKEYHSYDLILKISGSTIKVRSTGERNLDFTAKYDPKYTPKKFKTPVVRFLVTKGDYGNQAVLTKDMLFGSKFGFMQVSGDEDGYWNQNYKCVRVQK